MTHGRFNKNRVKCLSTWKMPSSEFLLLNENKNYDKTCKSYKNTNLFIIPNGVILIPKSQQESNISCTENQSGWAGEKPDDGFDKTKLSRFKSQLNNRYLPMIR